MTQTVLDGLATTKEDDTKDCCGPGCQCGSGDPLITALRKKPGEIGGAKTTIIDPTGRDFLPIGACINTGPFSEDLGTARAAISVPSTKEPAEFSDGRRTSPFYKAPDVDPRTTWIGC